MGCCKRSGELISLAKDNDADPAQMVEDDFDIKKKVEQVLEESGFSEQRAAKMDVDDLLK